METSGPRGFKADRAVLNAVPSTDCLYQATQIPHIVCILLIQGGFRPCKFDTTNQATKQPPTMPTRQEIIDAIIINGEQLKTIEILQISLPVEERWKSLAEIWCQQAIPQIQQNAITLDGMLEAVDEGKSVINELPPTPKEYTRLMILNSTPQLGFNEDDFQNAVIHGDIDLIDLLLFDKSITTCGCNIAIQTASYYGHLAVVERLLQDPVPSHPYRGASRPSVRRDVDPSADDNLAIRCASQNGHLAVIERLLQDTRVDPSSDNTAIRLASQNGHLAVIERLLQDPRVDPSANDNEAIRWASKYGHLAVVDRLLQDPRVDPSAGGNDAIRNASEEGHLCVVDRLLQDARVDPSVYNSYAFIFASKNGHLAVVERLLQDPRIDPTVMNNYAIQWAILTYHYDVVFRLLQDERINAFKMGSYLYKQLIERNRQDIIERFSHHPRLSQYTFNSVDLVATSESDD